MKHIKSFENHSNYQTFFEGPKFVRPNLSYCVQEEDMHYNYIIALKATYNVKDTSTPTIIANTLPVDVKELYVDGVLQQNISSSFTFSTLGEHQGKFVLNNNISNIREKAFSGCTDLIDIDIPTGVTKINGRAFEGCRNLAIEDLNLPNLTSLSGNAFKYTGIKHVSNLGHITTIPTECFCNCTQLIDIVVPEGVTSIGNNSIRGCTSMTTITIPSTITATVGSFNYNTPLRNVYITDFQAYVNITYNNGYSFLGNAGTNGHLYVNNIEPTTVLPYGRTVNNTTEHTFPQNITEIKNSVLNRVSSLVSVTIPSTVTRIGVDAFRQCSHLTNLTFENNSNLITIDGGAFESCDSLQAVNITDFEAWCNTTFGGTTRASNPARYSKHLYINGVEPVTLVPYGTQPSDNTTFVFPQNMSEIKDSTFSELSINTVTVPDSVTSIGRSSFENCKSLSAVNFTSNSQLTSIGNTSFKGCTALTNFTIPNSVTSIGSEAFRECTGLISITIPSSVTSIKDNAFYKTKLTSITISEGVIEIGGSAFGDGPRFTSVTIPSTVTKIGSYAFGGCGQLVSVTCLATTPPTLGSNTVFKNNASGRKIYVPAASVNAYKEATNWSTYAADIEAIS